MASSSNGKEKLKPGDYARKTFFLGKEVQNQKLGGLTKKVDFYRKMKCPVCEKICRTSFGKAMHIERFHPEIESGMEHVEEPITVDLSEDDDESEPQYLEPNVPKNTMEIQCLDSSSQSPTLILPDRGS